MDIDWIDSTDSRDVVGVAPDGGFYIHGSFHPLGALGALDCSKKQGIEVRVRRGELYFPMPWIRSQLASLLKPGSDPGSNPGSDQVQSSYRIKISAALNETLPKLMKRSQPSFNGSIGTSASSVADL